MIVSWLSLLCYASNFEYVFVHNATAIPFKVHGATDLTLVSGTGSVATQTVSGGGILASSTFASFIGECPFYVCEPATPNYAGTEFAFTHRRGRRQYFYVTSAATATYSVNTYSSSAHVETLVTGGTVTRGNVVTHEFVLTGKAVVFTATSGSIYVAVGSDMGPREGDYILLAPASTVVYGVVSRNAGLTVLGGPSEVTVVCDDGTTTTSPSSYIHAFDSSLNGFAGPACSYTATSGGRISAHTVGDGAGSDGVCWHPPTLFGLRTFLPSIDNIRIISDSPGSCTYVTANVATTLTLSGSAGVYAASQVGSIPSGTELVCISEVMVIVDVTTANFNDDEINAVMMPIATISPTHAPTTTAPTHSPTDTPTTSAPTHSPTETPTTSAPTHSPTETPTTSAPTHSP
eukprot:Hpha_TRINITY_DN16907_c0_g2::TRINITY_DN16907_c0_g2_i5::g.53997::m.53997